MKHYRSFCFFLCLFLSAAGYCANLVIVDTNSYWQCSAIDKSKIQWFATSPYRKIAINIAFDSCKKDSTLPESCKTSKYDCEWFHQGVSTKPIWRCTALDKMAVAWKSHVYPDRDEAAFAAKAFCKENSIVPDTCYLNFVTCMNLNEGALY